MDDDRQRRGRRRRGSGLIALVVSLAVIVVAGLVGYWYLASYAANAALERASNADFASTRINCTDRRIEGFPFQLSLGCGTISAARANLFGELAGLAADASLLAPGNVTAEFRSPLTLNAPDEGLALTASWSQANAAAAAWLDGLREVSAAFLALNIQTGANGPLPVASATAGSVEGSASPQDGDIYRFRAGAERLSVTSNGGLTLPEVDINLSLRALDFGTTLGTDPRETVLVWLRRGGTAEVERFRIGTGGATVSADGTLSLDADGLISGALTVRYTNLQALASLIETLRPDMVQQIEPALAMVTAMSVPVETEDGPGHQAPILIRDGVVAFGIIPFTTLPAVRL